MRALVFLLVAANLVFFAWTQGYLGSRESPDAIRLQQQIEADRLRVLSHGEPPVARQEPAVREEPAAKPTPVEKTPPVAEKKAAVDKCLAWPALAEGDATKLDALLAERFAGLRRTRHVLPETGAWWVFIPPLANKAEADKKAGELKRFNVPEFYIVQDAGPNRFAISLGIFSSEQAANDRLETLKGKGVRSAKVARRGMARAEQVSIEATGPEPIVDAAREAVGQQLPDLKLAVCGQG